MGYTGVYCRTKKQGIEIMMNDFREIDIVKKSWVGSTLYLAVKSENEVCGVVVLTNFSRNEFCWKIISESAGPCETSCPKSIIDILTKTEDIYSNEWRKTCLKVARNKEAIKKAPYNSIIKFKGQEPIIKRSPAYQFKTDWFQLDNGYYPKSKLKYWLDLEIE